VTIPAGDKAALFFASANRDEEVFGNPFEFRIDRQPNHHLAFGSGPHFCMGANLPGRARDALPPSAHPPGVVRAGRTARMLNSAVNGGIKHLPLRVDSARGGEGVVETIKFGIAFASIGPNIEPERACALAGSAERPDRVDLVCRPCGGARRLPVGLPVRSVRPPAVGRGHPLPDRSFGWPTWPGRRRPSVWPPASSSSERNPWSWPRSWPPSTISRPAGSPSASASAG